MGTGSHAMTESLSATVKAERAKRRWSQLALSLAAGISEKTVRRLESGEDMAAETVLSICAALDLPHARFGLSRKPPRTALPVEATATDSIRSFLAKKAPSGATVLAVDTEALLLSRLGPDYAARIEALAARPGPVPAFVSFLVFLSLAVAAICAAFVVNSWQAYLAVGLGVLGTYAFCRRSSDNDDSAEIEQAQAYVRRMRRTVFAIDGDTIECIELGANGAESRMSLPLRGSGHRSEASGPDHITFWFDLIEGELVIPFVPRTEASSALALR